MDDDDKTETPPKVEDINPKPEITPPPVTPPQETESNLTGLVDELKERVSELENVVAGLTTNADSTPTNLPWTHRLGRR